MLDFLDRIDLKCMCLASRDLRALSQSVLYREIDLSDFDMNRYSVAVLCLTHTIFRRPHLAQYTRYLDIELDPEWTEEISSMMTHTEQTHTLSDLFAEDVLGPIQNLMIERQSRSFFRSKLSTIPIMLISCLPNLQYLRITVDEHNLPLLVTLVQKGWGARQGYPLNRLRFLAVSYSGRKWSTKMSFRDISPFLVLPQLEELRVAGCTDSGLRSVLQSPFADLQPRTSSISFIGFAESYLNSESIQWMLTTCEALKGFSFNNRSCKLFQNCTGDLLSALHRQRRNIQDVRVSCTCGDFRPNGIIKNPISFHDYAQLKLLSLDQIQISPQTLLPCSLEHLIIQNCRMPVFHQVARIVSLSGTTLPSLKIISLYPDALFPGKMLDLPSVGATTLLLKQSQERLHRLVQGTNIDIRFEYALLEKIASDYSFAAETGPPGQYGPLIRLD